MQYTDLRPQIKTGDLLAWSHRSWGSWYDFKIQVVRMFTRSEYCHVGIAWVVNDRVFVIEAVSAGVRIFPLSKNLPCYWASNHKEIKPEALEWLFAQVGLPYKSQVKMVWQAITGNHELQFGRWQCSELVNRFFVHNWQALAAKDTPSAIVDDVQNKWPTGLFKLN